MAEMTKITQHSLNPQEILLIIAAIDLALASRRRGMNTAKNPAFKELYEKDLREYVALEQKLLTYK